MSKFNKFAISRREDNVLHIQEKDLKPIQRKPVMGRMIMALFLFAMIFTFIAPMQASAEIVTADLDAVVADCTAWIAYGVTSFLTLLGAGLSIVAASWVYRKVKAAIRSN